MRCPVEKHVIKKNGRSVFRNKRTGQLFPGKSKELILAEKHLISQMKPKAFPIDIPMHVMMHFHFAKGILIRKDGLPSLKAPDLSNLYELPQDCLQSAGVILNDCLIFSHDGSRKIESDSNWLEIFIFPFKGDDDGLESNI